MKKFIKETDELNKLVLKGQLPIAFFNTDIVELKQDSNSQNECMLKITFSQKYQQVNIPILDTFLIISKIYGI
ncbi:hypothetical protein M2306_000721 [Myroides gitamensis]|uniref:Uncharacterized protein n=1 Tax=Myroides odoratus TaxID=256 RepID=A0A378RLC4_MYROD|nr:hypothetical protein [Myroides odoratus]MCS4237954.1 hypothetical protein [Myroides odoratus]MDH6600027.1 hypothetical protein [Myroides gitamensis]QQU04738.1 hypothetical protein I6I89_05465 [Myroides odoratus]STZ27816.1 Uncharacterised protein [Myroides odoratus]